MLDYDIIDVWNVPQIQTS